MTFWETGKSLLDRLSKRGITLRVKDDGVGLQAAPAGSLTSADLDELRPLRAAVVYRLLLREWYGIGEAGGRGAMTGDRLVALWNAYRDLRGVAEAIRSEEGV